MRVAQVAHPFAVEVLGVGVVQRRAGKYLCVARPAEALVPLRTVGRHAQEVAPLSPPYITIQLVDARVRAGKLAPFLNLRAHHLAYDLAYLHLLGSCHRYVAESHECVARSVALTPTVAAEGIAQRAIGLAQVVGPYAAARTIVEPSTAVAIVVEHLAVAEGDLGASFGLSLKVYPSHHVLPHVDDRRLPFLQCEGAVLQGAVHLYHTILGAGLHRFAIDGHPLRTTPQRLVADAHLGTFEGDYRHRHTPQHRYPLPFAGCVACIIHLPIVYLAQQQRSAVAALPGIVGARYALSVDHHLGLQCQRSVAAIYAAADLASPPSVAQLRAYLVLALAQQRGNVHRLAGHLLAVVRPSRLQLVSLHMHSVHGDVIHAQCRSRQRGLLYGLIVCYHLAEDGQGHPFGHLVARHRRIRATRYPLRFGEWCQLLCCYRQRTDDTRYCERNRS